MCPVQQLLSIAVLRQGDHHADPSAGNKASVICTIWQGDPLFTVCTRPLQPIIIRYGSMPAQAIHAHQPPLRFSLLAPGAQLDYSVLWVVMQPLKMSARALIHILSEACTVSLQLPMALTLALDIAVLLHWLHNHMQAMRISSYIVAWMRMLSCKSRSSRWPTLPSLRASGCLQCAFQAAASALSQHAAAMAPGSGTPSRDLPGTYCALPAPASFTVSRFFRDSFIHFD